MKLVGANPSARVTGLDPLPGKSNYFIGNDPKKWRTNVSNYAKVKYEGVYPGIDLVYYGTEGGQLEYDFVVAPGADLKAIAFELVGADGVRPAPGERRSPLRIDPAGDLVIATDARELRFHKPVVYQPVAPVSSPATGGGTPPLQSTAISNPGTPNPGFTNLQSPIGNRQSVDGRFVLLADNRVGFEVPDYDKTKPLVIDPVLEYSTFLGGSDYEYGYAIGVDISGNAYTTGYTPSTDFPTMSPLQGSNAGGFDAFVTKLSAAGDALVYSTYLGGSNHDIGYGIAVDTSGNAYLTGTTESTDFPTMSPLQGSYAGDLDAFVTKLNIAGDALAYSTYLGGSGLDYGTAIAVDTSGNAYLAGDTESPDFPTMSPLQGASAGFSDVFATKLNAAGDALVYSTYLGGSDSEYGGPGSMIAVDTSGNAYVAGTTFSTDFPTMNPFQGSKAGNYDAFVTKLSAAGDALVYSTYLGGSNFDAGSIAVDTSGNAYVAGITESPDFPVVNPLPPPNNALRGDADAFVSKLNAAGDALVYSTYLGGSDSDGATIAVDTSGAAYLTGGTLSTDFPTMSPLQGCYAGNQDAFVAKLNAAGDALLYSTYLGGSDDDGGSRIAVDTSGIAYLTGYTLSTDFPIMSPLQGSYAGNQDAFVAKITNPPGPAVTLNRCSLTFGTQLVGTTSSVQTITLTNTGDALLSISSLDASGDFAETDTCGTSVAAGANCTISATFTPSATSTRVGGVTITSNAPGSPHSVTLTGTGTDFAISIPAGEDSKTVSAGSAGTYSILIVTTGFVGNVTLGCAFQGATPRGASCSVSPNTVALNGTDPAPFTVRVATTARSLAVPRGPELPRAPSQRHLVPLLVGVMLLAAVAAASRRRSPVRTPALRWAPLGAMLVVVLLWAACGGGGGSPATPQTGTPAGNYTLTLTATAGGVSKTADLSLRVN